MTRVFAAALMAAMGISGSAMAGGSALVIGNGDYAHAPEATTAVNDATAVADALDAAGWAVTRGTDLGRFAMRRVISRFAETLAETDEVVIFYSGHALRTGGSTYLAPTDALAETQTDVLFDGVPLDLALMLAAAKAGKAVIFIDGAQLRGFRPTDTLEPGLAALEGPEGVMIVSAAQPGEAVRRARWQNSRFVQVILDRFLKPGATVATVAADVESPIYVTGEVDDDFVLAPPPEGVNAADVSAEIELAFWRAAERSGRAEDYAAYLERFPRGIFADFARERLGLNQQAATPAEPEVDPKIQTERDLSLSRIRKRQIQTWLQALGHDPRGIDGLFGPGSRRAIRGWQAANGLENHGWLDAPQLRRLGDQGRAAIAEQERIAAERRRIEEAEDNAYWSETGARGKPAGYRAYLEKYPDGKNAAVARAALAKIAEARADAQARKERRIYERAIKTDTVASLRDYLAQYPQGIYRDQAQGRLNEIETAERAAVELDRLKAAEGALRLSRDDRRWIEGTLKSFGFAVGKADGKMDATTRAAIKGYQAARGLEGSGFLNRETLVALTREVEEVTRQSQQSAGPRTVPTAQVINEMIRILRQ